MWQTQNGVRTHINFDEKVINFAVFKFLSPKMLWLSRWNCWKNERMWKEKKWNSGDKVDIILPKNDKNEHFMSFGFQAIEK